MIDPAGGDYRLQPGSPAAGYGCLSFPGPATAPDPAAVRPVAARGRASIEVSGTLTENAVWDADTVKVTGDLTVADGVTLDIAPGVLVEFQGYHLLAVQGRLRALGEPEARIRFDSAEPALFAPDSSEAGAWRGIRFAHTPETNGASLLRFCVIEHAKGIGKGEEGGALGFVGFSRCRVENTILRANAADLGAAVYASLHAAPDIVGCLIEGNHAFRAGAGLYCVDAFPRLAACTIVANVDLNPESFDRTGPVVAMLSKPRLDGCVVWDNVAHYFIGTHVVQTKPFYTTYNDVETGLEGEGNISIHPRFMGEGEHPWAIGSASSCRDAGPPAPPGPALPDLDLAGNPRIDGGRVDIGCYEGDGTLTHAGAAPAPAFGLSAHPNPFNPRTRIVFTLPRAASATLEIRDVRGRRVASLHRGPMPAGAHGFDWDGRDERGAAIASGLYLTRLSGAGGTLATGKLLLLR